MDMSKLNDFASRYTAAWCSHDAARVASFFAPSGSLTINDGAPAVGRAAIAAAAQGFMTAFPDLIVEFERLDVVDDRVRYHWALHGKNTGPGGNGNAVHIRGNEAWRIDGDGLIADSLGHFDEAEYKRQLAPMPKRS